MSNTCYLLTDGDEHVGYFRCRANAETAAKSCSAPDIAELDPPEPIACDDDPEFNN